MTDKAFLGLVRKRSSGERRSGSSGRSTVSGGGSTVASIDTDLSCLSRLEGLSGLSTTRLRVSQPVFYGVEPLTYCGEGRRCCLPPR